MFEKYSYKIKFRALIVMALLLGLTAYKRSFGPLLQLLRENEELRVRSADLKRGTTELPLLQSQVAAIDKILGKEGVNKEKIQQQIIGFIAADPEIDVHINDLKAIHEFSDTNYRIYTHEIDLTGKMNNLLRLAYDFERNFQGSRLIAMSFYTARKNNEEDILHLKLTFQNYESTK